MSHITIHFYSFTLITFQYCSILLEDSNSKPEIHAIACSKHGIHLSSANKSLLFTLPVRSSTVQTQSSRSQISTIGTSGTLKITNLLFLDSEDLLIFSADERLYLYQIQRDQQPELLACATKHTLPLKFLKATGTGEFIYTASNDGFVCVYSLFELIEQGDLTSPLLKIKVSNCDISGVDVLQTSPSWIKLFVTSSDHFLRIWDLDLSIERWKDNSENGKEHLLANENDRYDFQHGVTCSVIDPTGLHLYLVLDSDKFQLLKYNGNIYKKI